MPIPRILTIAGSDSGGGAGIQADIKTITMLGGHAMTALTALTAQNTVGVTQVMPVPAAMVIAQIDAVAGDIGVDAVKIGMIGSAEVADAVAERLGRSDFGGITIVFDPVMIATSGAALADKQTIAAFERLMARATLVTPNLPELALLVDRAIGDGDALARAAGMLAGRTGGAVLAKGGHLDGPEVVDILIADGRERRWRDDRIATRHSHGTGCTLSSAIATGLGAGMDLEDAIDRGRAFVRASLLAAPGLGAGHGPMGQGSVLR
ncbi:bifunctional hydroxymethylpyrimidine kinase/phosphomethylpyrimidine kinase [Sphingomonas bacterium]|uniref:bifunctional hydroxymethylpyrimidine kinase/phosphomethylpyrimidine kinase n=1 Tax=Sphingomonas bacterium TaxID=1895847 RepID=UPI0015767136|nr:bifunctional hydroxymethylpyrimidine kinase/phosphomethylpyrimidine kinase [Sphingomonas bacterium]